MESSIMKQTAGLSALLQASDTLSPCIYSTAIHSLWTGVGTAGDIKWLLEHRNADGSWGNALSWQDQYLSTYACGLALLKAGLIDLGSLTLKCLPGLTTGGRDYRTLNFGGLVGALDAYARNRFHIRSQHPLAVSQQVAKETEKWAMVMHDGHFYDPSISIAGFFGEC